MKNPLAQLAVRRDRRVAPRRALTDGATLPPRPRRRDALFVQDMGNLAGGMRAITFVTDEQTEDPDDGRLLGLPTDVLASQDLPAIVPHGLAAVAVGKTPRAVPVTRAAFEATPRFVGQVPEELLVHGALDAVEQPRALGVQHGVDAVCAGDELDPQELEHAQRDLRVRAVTREPRHLCRLL
jgi:hypothetical protein